MGTPIVVSCPQCGQKYRLPPERIGSKARCRCGQRFTIALNQPLDDDTILGWVLEDADPSSESVMGGTGIFDSPASSGPNRADQSSSSNSPASLIQIQDGVHLVNLDGEGACFEFPALELTRPSLRTSFPKQCVSCGSHRDLYVHLIVWHDRLTRDDPRRLSQTHNLRIGKLRELARFDQPDWIGDLTPIPGLASPFDLPFPFYVCGHCDVQEELAVEVRRFANGDGCRLTIANLEVACHFFRNNDGAGTPDYARLIHQCERQQQDRWQRLPFALRRQLRSWYEPVDGEQFRAYFRDVESDSTDEGREGLILTDRRIAFRKNTSDREFALDQGGKILVETDLSATSIRIQQKGQKEAVVQLDQHDADQLIHEVRHHFQNWKITGQSNAR